MNATGQGVDAMGMRERQRGLSMLGFLFVAVVVIVVALVGFRMVPAYIEYYSVQKALAGGDGRYQRPQPRFGPARGRPAPRRRLRRFGPRFRRHADEGPATPTPPNSRWEKRLPLVYNVSLVLDFNASASK